MDFDHNSSIPWPPIYTVKKHPRAKHIRLKASIQRGLELIVPHRFNLKDIPGILEKNKQWIEKQLLHFQSRLLAAPADVLPDQINLQAINQVWNVQYIESDTKLQILQRPHQELVLLGNTQNKTTCKKTLVTWIKEQSKIHLLSQLKTLSEQTELPFSKFTIRDQLTRWGSCSRNKSINLNYKLIFFPPHLATHIMIHELCHTVHLNHSEQFWQWVAKFDMNWKLHRREAKQANKFIPGWV